MKADITQEGSTISIQFTSPDGECRLGCSGANGGRITSFSLDNHEILVQPNSSGMFGSTFWTAPENWGWPPPLAVDANPYRVGIDKTKGVIELTSDVAPVPGVRISKRLSVTQAGDGINVDYTIMNPTDKHKKYAPWEISRVEKGGITFYRSGDRTPDARNRGVMNIQRHGDICAYHHPTNLVDDGKLFDCSADGWIAHTDGRLIFLKQYGICERLTPGEGDIEIYACPNYVEVEQQGNYDEIAPGDATTWRVVWSLHSLPEKTKTSDTATLVPIVDEILRHR